MTAARVKFHQIIKGSLMETEDWWRLVTEDDGQIYIEHEWSHVDPYKLSLPSNSGTERFGVDEFLGSDAPESAKNALRKMLG